MNNPLENVVHSILLYNTIHTPPYCMLRIELFMKDRAMNVKKRILTITAVLFLIILVAILGAGYYFSGLVVKPGVWEYDKTFESELEYGRFTREYYDSLPGEDLYIDSPNGYRLHAVYVPRGSNKTVIFVHGHTYTLLGDYKYLEIFRSRGYNALMFDSRYHGKSGGDNVTFGRYEKHDLEACVDWVKKKQGEDGIIGVHGESMGSAICLLHAAEFDSTDFYIVDGPMADLGQLLAYRMKKDFGLPGFPLLQAASLASRVRGAMWFGDISPIEHINQADAPIFFIHGGEDSEIPVEHSKRLYSRYNGKKKIWICPGAGHSKSIIVNRKEYEKQVHAFLKDIGAL